MHPAVRVHTGESHDILREKDKEAVRVCLQLLLLRRSYS